MTPSERTHPVPTVARDAASVGPARPDDLEAVAQLLRGAGLPEAGLGDQFPQRFVVARAGTRVAAAAGLEVHGNVGLLRSVVVEPSLRGMSVGRALVEDRCREAGALGLRSVYLLTTTAAPFFAKLGFEHASRDTVPDALRASVEFKSACPASATCMRRRLR